MVQLDWWTLFWGGLLIIYGISLILKAFFGIHIPIFKPVLGIFLIYVGFVVLTGIDPVCKIDSKHYGKKGCQNVAFGQQYIDLTHKKIDEKPERIDLNVAFGHAIVKLDPQIPTKISAKAAFGKVEFPDGSSIGLGRDSRVFGGPLKDRYLDIRAHVQFGSIEFVTVSE